MITAKNIWQEQEEIEQKHQAKKRALMIKKNQDNYDLAKQAVKMLMSNEDFNSKEDAVVQKALDEEITTKATRDDIHCIYLTDSFWLGSHQRKNDYTAVEHKIGRLLFKYLPPVLNKLGVSNRKAWLKREAFTFTPYVKSELVSALIQAVKEYWKSKLTKKGYSWKDCTNANSIMLIW